MAKSNRVCIACGKEYYYCPTCGTNQPLWMKTYDCKECKDAHEAIGLYNYGNMSAEEANKILNATNVKFINEKVQSVANKIKSETAPKKVEKAEESEKKIFKPKKDIVNED